MTRCFQQKVGKAFILRLGHFLQTFDLHKRAVIMAYLFRKIELVFLTRTLLTVSSHSIWKNLNIIQRGMHGCGKIFMVKDV